MTCKLTARPVLGVLIALALALPAFAQPPATVVMKSGERKPALNMGLFDGTTLIVRTSFEEEPRIPIDQVAYIDFGTGGPMPARPRPAQHSLMMRDGRVMMGQ